MFNLIDNLVDSITMYRLALYVLIAYVAIAAGLGAFGILAFKPLDVIFTALVLVGMCWAVNNIFARIFRAQANVESAYITALILACIITPIAPANTDGIMFLLWASAIAMASKYILAIRKKHIFNPAALAVAVTSVALSQSASWWIGTSAMLPAVVIGGILIVRKLRRFDVVWAFLAAAVAAILLTSVSLSGLFHMLSRIVLDTPIVFFATIMLTEPLTMPPNRSLRIFYGIAAGILFAPNVHFGSVYSTPELALLAGNVYSYLVSPKGKHWLVLVEKSKLGKNLYEFIFASDRKMKFTPGQYLEWTLAHDHSDSRGNRRYFTIASSPTEPEIRLGVKLNEPSSSYKKALMAMKPGDGMPVSQLSGDFTLPADPKKKLAFIAGGIGITPFRSMVKYLNDSNDRRSVVLLYSNKTSGEIAYADIWDQAEQNGIRTVHTLTDKSSVPASWQGYTGGISEEMIMREMPDYKERTFYVSGPHGMVVAFQKVLHKLGIPRGQIKTDYFPGFA